VGTPRWWAPVLGISLCDELSWLMVAGRWPPLAAGVAWHGAARHDGMTKKSWVVSPYVPDRRLHEGDAHEPLCNLSSPVVIFQELARRALIWNRRAGDSPAETCAEVARKLSESRQACQGASVRSSQERLGTSQRLGDVMSYFLFCFSFQLEISPFFLCAAGP
jgi:hypothetical protein